MVFIREQQKIGERVFIFFFFIKFCLSLSRRKVLFFDTQ